MDSGDRAIDQRVWTREEVCLLVAEYFRTKGMSKDEILQSRKIVPLSYALMKIRRCYPSGRHCRRQESKMEVSCFSYEA